MRKTCLSLLGCLLLIACSGAEVIPGPVDAFVATGFTRYAWRSEPLPQGTRSTDLTYQADPVIRAAIDERLGELGYRRVAKDEAEFLVDYMAAAGFNDARLPRTASNISPLPTATLNRQVNQAEVDNAYALSGVREMGNVAVVFLNAANQDLLWQVTVSSIIEDRNEINPDSLQRTMRRTLTTLPEAGS